MKNLFTLILLLTLSGILSPIYGQWSKHTIDPDLTNATVLHYGDIDGDTDLDVVVSAWSVNDVVWYENGGDNLTWTKHIIDGNLTDVIGVYDADIDGDDTLDVVAAGWEVDEVVWYENILPDTTWLKRTIDGDLDGADWIYVADIDGDNDNDVAATGNQANDVVWYRNDGGIPITWNKQTIDAALPEPRHVDVADIDGDTLLDVVATSYTANDVVWYENPNWNKSIIDGNLIGARVFYAVDIDDDYDTDVIALGQSANDVVWYENDIPDGVEPLSDIVPAHYELSQNYPNPFNPNTTIKYQIPEIEFVTLKVYDVLGSEVARLVNEEKSIGTYEITWTAENLPSGIYFYSLRAGDFIETKKMILLK